MHARKASRAWAKPSRIASRVRPLVGERILRGQTDGPRTDMRGSATVCQAVIDCGGLGTSHAPDTRIERAPDFADPGIDRRRPDSMSSRVNEPHLSAAFMLIHDASPHVSYCGTPAQRPLQRPDTSPGARRQVNAGRPDLRPRHGSPDCRSADPSHVRDRSRHQAGARDQYPRAVDALPGRRRTPSMPAAVLTWIRTPPSFGRMPAAEAKIQHAARWIGTTTASSVG
jgi:hypothetical protein